MKLTNRAYDILNALVQIILPSAGTLYFGLAQIWGIPNGEKVVGSIVAVDTFLGVVQAWFKKNYEPETHGTVLLDNSAPAGQKVTLQVNHTLEDLKPGNTYLLGVEEKKPAQPPTD